MAETSGGPPQTVAIPSKLRLVFLGPNGIRAGWRLLIYFAITAGISAALFPLLLRLLHHHRGEHISVLTPGASIFFEGLSLFVALVAAIIMRRIENGKWDHYGLPLSRAFRGEFWIGIICGFGALSTVMLCLWLAHAYTIEGLALHGGAILKFGALWAIGFLFVGLYEEFIMRGYSLYTLASGIGFWPSAVFLSFIFFVGHIHNSGEDWLGLLSVFLFGMFACFTLWKTGNLWFAVGVHAAWDWGLTFFYSAPDSGLMAEGQLFRSHFSGPWWLSGGAAGPEGSIFTIVLLLLWSVIIAVLLPRRKWIGMDERRLASAASFQAPLIDSSALSGGGEVSGSPHPLG